MDTLSPEAMAAAIERTRYQGLRKEPWDELRESERDTRVDVMRNALAESGITAAVAEVVARGERADELAAQVAERDAELRRRQADHDADLVRLTARVQELEAELVATRAAAAAELARTSAEYDSELADARTGEQRAVHRAQQAERALDAVRTALATVPRPEAAPAIEEVPGAQASAPARVAAPAVADEDVTAPRGLFGRRARSAH